MPFVFVFYLILSLYVFSIFKFNCVQMYSFLYARLSAQVCRSMISNVRFHKKEEHYLVYDTCGTFLDTVCNLCIHV